jgi:ParB family chromosome partitioning protein
VSDITHIGDLTPDPQNARKHNPRNVGMLERSLNEVGAARSIVIDENGVILAGNATIEAAAQAGIERVQVVDVDGETIVAVRRSNLTDAQKTALALFDNRSAELAEWDAGVLAGLADEGVDLSGLFFDNELSLVLSEPPGADEWGVAFGGLPDGDRAPFQQMTFTLSDEQAEQVKRAIERARGLGPFVDTGNENGNGNALARVCEVFLGIG